MKHLLRFFRWLPAGLVSAWVRMCKVLPAALDRAHLQWAAREIDPQHPDVPYIVHRLRNLEDQLNA